MVGWFGDQGHAEENGYSLTEKHTSSRLRAIKQDQSVSMRKGRRAQFQVTVRLVCPCEVAVLRHLKIETIKSNEIGFSITHSQSLFETMEVHAIHLTMLHPRFHLW